MNYTDFLKSKVAVAKHTGFEGDSFNPTLFDFIGDAI
jgi:hypothetical protein